MVRLLTAFSMFFGLRTFLTFGNAKECNKTMVFKVQILNKALINHTIKTEPANDNDFCQALCFMDDRCLSCTFDSRKLLCNLSDSDHIMHPEHLMDTPNAIFWSAENTCNCSQKNMTCRYNFAENTHRCECPPKSIGENCEIPYILGAKSSTPGSTCRAIRNAGDSKGDIEYWMKPVGVNDPFLVTCHMSLLGRWKKIDRSWISSIEGYGTTNFTSESNGGLVVTVNVVNRGCGSVGSVSVVYIKGYWTKIRYTQEFRGTASCWKIFGANEGAWWDSNFGNVTEFKNGLFSFDKSKDMITNEHYMEGQIGHTFKGTIALCNNEKDNFWHQLNQHIPLKYATVTLRRDPGVPLAGISTHTSCGLPSYVLKDIEIYF